MTPPVGSNPTAPDNKYRMRYVDFGVLGKAPDISDEEISVMENEIVYPTFHWIEPQKHNKVGQTNGEDVFESEPDIDGLITISVKYAYLRYAIMDTGWRYICELQTHQDHRKQGHATHLLIFCVKKLGPMIMDRQLSVASASMIEKLVASGALSGNIANLSTGEMNEYNPNNVKHQQMGLYDKVVFGINRPLIPTKEAEVITWVLEQYVRPRHASLQPLTRNVPKL